MIVRSKRLLLDCWECIHHYAPVDVRNNILDLVVRRAAAQPQYTGTYIGVLLGLSATRRRCEYSGALSSPQSPARWLTVVRWIKAAQR